MFDRLRFTLLPDRGVPRTTTTTRSRRFVAAPSPNGRSRWAAIVAVALIATVVSSTHLLAQNNPPATYVECPDCPPPMVVTGSPSGYADQFFAPNDPNYPGSSPFPGGFPGMNPPVDPGGGNPEQELCDCCICWFVEEHCIEILWFYFCWETVEHVSSCDTPIICAGMNQSFDVCSGYQVPKNDDGSCGSDDPDDPWGDKDGDGLPNALDLDPENDGGPLNPNGLVPPDKEYLDQLLRNYGGQMPEGWTDTLPDNPEDWDFNDDGMITLADTYQTLWSIAEVDQDALQQMFGPDSPSVNAVQALAAVLGHNEDLKALHSLTELINDAFFGGAEEKADLLASLEGQIEANQDIAAALEAHIEAQVKLLTQFAAVGAHVLTVSLAMMVDIFAPGVGTSMFLPPSDGTHGNDVDLEDGDGMPTEPPGGGTEDVPGGMESTIGDPVDTWSGEYVYQVTDLRVAGRGMDLEFERHYRSRSNRKGFVGRNWSMPGVETHIVHWPGADGKLLDLFWGNGTRSYLTLNETTGLYNGTNGFFGKAKAYFDQFPDEPQCESDLAGYVLRKTDGRVYYFCPGSLYIGLGGMKVSWLRKIVDPYGNAIVFRRDSWGRPTEIVDTLGRSFFLEFDEEHQLLESITDPTGRVVTYSYDKSVATPSTGGSGVIVGTTQITGPMIQAATLAHLGPTGQQGQPRVWPEPEPQAHRQQLLQVDYPTTQFLSDGGVVVTGQPYERYEYDEHPDGFDENPEPHINHNLLLIQRDAAGPAVTIEYYKDDPEAQTYDRVKAVTVAGERTDFTYEYRDEGGAFLDLGNPYGHSVHAIATVRFSDGSLNRFYHDEDGFLLRKEVDDGFDVDGDFAADNVPSDGPLAWVDLWEYDLDDYQVTSRSMTTTAGYPLGAIRRKEFVRDTVHPDRFQQGHVLEIIEYPDPTIAFRGDPADLRLVFSYDEITGQRRSMTNALGETTEFVFEQQEGSVAQASQRATVAGWGIVFDATAYGRGDVNGDLKTDSVEPVQILHPPVPIADPQDPSAPPTVQQPIERMWFNAFGQVHKVFDAEGTETRTTYFGGYPFKITRDPGGLTFRETRVHDALGRMTTQVTGDQRWKTFRYDGRGLLIETREKSAPTPSINVSRPLGGGGGPPFLLFLQAVVPGQSYPDRVLQTFYDANGRERGTVPPFMTTVANTYPNGLVPELEMESFYDEAGHKVERRRTIVDEFGIKTGTWRYTYDSREQLRRSYSVDQRR